MSCYVIDRHNFTEKTHDLECRRCNVAMFFHQPWSLSINYCINCAVQTP